MQWHQRRRYHVAHHLLIWIQKISPGEWGSSLGSVAKSFSAETTGGAGWLCSAWPCCCGDARWYWEPSWDYKTLLIKIIRELSDGTTGMALIWQNTLPPVPKPWEPSSFPYFFFQVIQTMLFGFSIGCNNFFRQTGGCNSYYKINLLNRNPDISVIPL